MTTLIIVLILCLLINSGCKTDDTADESITIEKAHLLLNPKHESANVVVNDINIYVFHTLTSKCYKHIFYSSSQIESDFNVKLPLGKYVIYAIANSGEDFGDCLSISDIQSLKYRLETQKETCLPMFGAESIELTNNTHVDILLKNCTVKISYSIEIGDNLKDMLIKAVILRNIPVSGAFSPESETYIKTYKDFQYNIGGSRSFSDTIFVAENLAGENNNIKTQKDKNICNAPVDASYIEILTTTNKDTFKSYHVFLGKNNTSDFNLKRNTSQIMNIRIEGEDIIDTRMESDTIEIHDDIFEKSKIDKDYALPSNGYCLKFKKLKSSNDIFNRTYSASIELINGDGNYFTFNGMNFARSSSLNINGNKSLDVQLGNLSSDMIFQLGYNPPVIDQNNFELKYRVILTCSNGNTYSEDFVRSFSNILKIKYDKLLGTIDHNYGSGKKKYKDDSIIVLTPESSIVLKPLCMDGCCLKGWYRHNGQIITQNEKYTHFFTSSSESIIMNLIREKVYIYTKLNDVELNLLKTKPIINYEKNAYVVNIGDYCAMRGKDLTKLIEGWYDENGKLISKSPEYDFNATENRYIYPRFK